MVTVYDVSPTKLIPAVAKELKGMGITQPEFIDYVKSGPHRERKPQQPDFWYTRLASLLRQTYIHENVGINRLRTHYGGSKNRGTRKDHHCPAGGAVIRRGLQSLEEAGLIKKVKVGREITGKGKALLDKIAMEVSKV